MSDRGEAVSGVLEAQFSDPPGGARIYRAARHVHLGDVNGSGAMRLEALARFLQDVATDDALEAGLRAQLGGTWVLRRLAVEIAEPAQFNDDVEFATFCSGWGPSWAERRTDMAGGTGEVLARTVAIWVIIDQAGGRPINLGDEFFEIYGAGARDRRVSARLRHPRPPIDAARRPWPLRESDFDFLDHVNNARYLEAVEDELAIRLPEHAVAWAELEFRGAVARGDALELATVADETRAGEAELTAWLLVDGDVKMSARLGTRFTPATRPLPR
jgi:acyl-ACP thioesterase